MLLNDFIALFYPDLCLVCGNNLLKHEEYICITCLHKTPKTNCFKQRENEVSKIFWGRSKLENAAALFTFNKDRNTKKLIHTLKYEEGGNVGVFLGKQLAFAIKESEFFKSIDIVIAVPLHPKKQKIIGYNQSDFIAQGIKEILNIKVNKQSLIRIENTDSQRRKKRFNRWENMMNSFDLRSSKKLRRKHILLVDDVITTGSTLEACAQKLQEVEAVKVSIETIAVA